MSALWFILGLVVGANVGIVIMAIITVGARADRQEEALRKAREHRPSTRIGTYLHAEGKSSAD